MSWIASDTIAILPVKKPPINSKIENARFKTKAIRMVLYIVIGFCAFSSLFVIGDKVNPIGVKYVLAGNGAYIVGLILFAIGAKKKYFHTIFHIFVIIGATIHFINLYQYVFI